MRALFHFDRIFLFCSRIKDDNIFQQLNMDQFSSVDQERWIEWLFHIFEQIYGRDLDPSYSFQPQTYDNTLPVSPTTFLYQPLTLWEQCQFFIERSSPRYYVCGQDVNGNAVSSVTRCLELRHLTGRTKQFCGALKARMRFKRDPRFLRTVVQGSYWPTTAAQWKFWKDALFWVYEQIWGMSNLPTYVLSTRAMGGT